jgi:ParB family transcriptional regulator, chromosome partitioning protein
LLGGAPAKPAPLPVTNIIAEPPAPGERVRQVPIHKVRPCAFQPRKQFNEETLQELALSIKQQGILQPLIVRDAGTHLELIAGERRWRAAELAGLKEIPVIVREADNRLVLELALVENLQRDNLNPLEEALGYSQLIEQFQLRQEDVAVKVGKSRAVVANALRLLKLDPELQNYIRDGRLSVGHAKVILALTLPAEQKLAAERVIKQSLNVRQTEELVTHLQNQKPPDSGSKASGTLTARDPHVNNVENRLRERLGTKVHLRYRQGKGAIEIRYFSDVELERLLGILGIEVE